MIEADDPALALCPADRRPHASLLRRGPAGLARGGRAAGGLLRLAALGRALAALLLWGVRLWPGITLGTFLLNWTAGVPAAGAAGIAVGNTLEAVAATWLLARVLDFRPSLERVRDVIALVVVAALASTALSATIGVTSLWASGAVAADGPRGRERRHDDALSHQPRLKYLPLLTIFGPLIPE